jgi:hypothetical protein
MKTFMWSLWLFMKSALTLGDRCCWECGGRLVQGRDEPWYRIEGRDYHRICSGTDRFDGVA